MRKRYADGNGTPLGLGVFGGASLGHDHGHGYGYGYDDESGNSGGHEQTGGAGHDNSRNSGFGNGYGHGPIEATAGYRSLSLAVDPRDRMVEQDHA